MCKNCQVSEMGQQRQVELEAAKAQALAAGVIADGVSGFLNRYGARRDRNGRPGSYVYTAEQRAALDRYNAAEDAMKELHRDYVFAGMRREQERIAAIRAQKGA